MKNIKGFTLVELIITIALLGVITTAATGIFMFTNDTFFATRNQQNIQSDMRLITNFIERELAYASNVEVLNSVPVTFDTSRRYIYFDSNTNKVMYKEENSPAVEVKTVVSENDYSLEFNKTGNTTLDYSLDGQLDNQQFSITSEIEFFNLKGIREVDKISGTSGPAVTYAFDSDAKDITDFRFESDLNSALSVDIEPQFTSDSITLFVPHGTDISSLIPSFVTTGIRVTVNNVDQVSGTTANNYTNERIYTVHAQDGTTKEYKVNVNILPATPPNASSPRIIPTDPDGSVTPIAWNTSTLNADYTYIPNGNGPEGSSLFEWFVSDSESGSYTKIIGESSDTYLPTTQANKWIKFRVKPVSNLGIQGDSWVESDPVQVFDNSNPFWKKIVEDLWYTNATPQEQQDFDDDYGSDYSQDLELVYNEYFKRHIDNTNDHSVVADMGDQSVVLRGRGWSASSEHQFGIDLDYDAFNIDPEGYTFTFDTVLSSSTWGWGLAFSAQPDWHPGEVGELFDNLNGYAFQFDPGADGFVMRRFYRGGSRSKHELGANNLNANTDATYRPSIIVRNPGFSWRGTDDGSNRLWDENYTTEMTVQRQLDNSLIVRVVTWKTSDGRENGASQAMWYGDFGQLSYNGNTFRGHEPSNKNYNDYNDVSLYNIAFGSQPSTFLGFRVWASGNYRADFLNLDVAEGFSMNIESAEFISNDEIYIKFDQNIRNEFRTTYNGGELFTIENGLKRIDNLVRNGSDGVTVKLENPLTNTEMANGVEIDIRRGAVRAQFSGDIPILNGENYRVVGESHDISISDAYLISNSCAVVEMVSDITDTIDQSKINLKDSRNTDIPIADVFVNEGNQLILLLENSLINSQLNQDLILNLAEGSVEHTSYGVVPISNGTDYTFNDMTQIIYQNDFESGSINNWSKYRQGNVSIKNLGSNRVLHKKNNNDPNGGYTDIGTTINDSSFIFECKINRNRTNGGNWDRLAISNNNATGYGVAFSNNKMRIESRNNGNASLLKEVNFNRPNTEWYRVVYIINQSGDLILKAYDDSNNLLSETTINNTTYISNDFSRIYVHGGYEFYVDDISVGVFK